MKVAVALLFLIHSIYGFSHCNKAKNFDPDISKYNRISLESIKLGIFHVSREDVTFRLWTREQNIAFAPIYFGHLADEPAIRPDKPFKFIIHGWSDCADAEWYLKLKNEYLEKGDYNIVQVDWRKPAGSMYPLSASYTKDVGQYTGELIVDLHETLKVPLENIHLIGHSLGAHISGYAGQTVQKLTKKSIGRITGLDPAGPLFILAATKNRLNKDAALYVDVIHTDGGKLGYNGILGHADFYPNGGHSPQPGCVLRDFVDFSSCSHTRSFYFYEESINSNGFIAHECSNYNKYKSGECVKSSIAIMGENVNNAHGVFYLSTNSKNPFAKNELL